MKYKVTFANLVSGYETGDIIDIPDENKTDEQIADYIEKNSYVHWMYVEFYAKSQDRIIFRERIGDIKNDDMLRLKLIKE